MLGVLLVTGWHASFHPKEGSAYRAWLLSSLTGDGFMRRKTIVLTFLQRCAQQRSIGPPADPSDRCRATPTRILLARQAVWLAASIAMARFFGAKDGEGTLEDSFGLMESPTVHALSLSLDG